MADDGGRRGPSGGDSGSGSDPRPRPAGAQGSGSEDRPGPGPGPETAPDAGARTRTRPAPPRPSSARPSRESQAEAREDTDDPGTRRSRRLPGAGRHSAPDSRIALPRSPVVLVLIVIVVLVAAGAAVVILTRSPAAPPTPVAESYLAAWTRRDFGAMAALVEHPPPDFVTVHQGTYDDLGVTSWKYTLGAVTTHGNTADAAYTAHIVLGGLGPWDHQGTVHLARVLGHWTVEWTPATIFPTLPIGGHFSVQRTWSPRAAVLGTGGTVLAGPSDIVTVGLQGNAVTSPEEVASAMAQIGVDSAVVSAALKSAAAHPTQFVPVADLASARYDQVKPIIFRVPGTRFQRHTGQMSVTPDLAAHVVGSVGPITADELSQLGAPYQASDSVGQSGIEARYERQLAGSPGGTVQILSAAGSVVATALTVDAKAGVAVQTTIDLHTEQAAEAALNGVTQPAALVAVRASTGEILAAVSRPDSTPFDRALEGQYPPGSTFKVITADALLTSGLTPASPTTCPPALTVQGKTFTNFEGESAPNISLSQAFAVSCNTAFISMAGKLTAQSLSAAATQFGFGTTPQVGLPAFGGQVPSPVDEVEKVASAIGQGRVLASPVEMAGVAAGVASGVVHAPRLVAGAPDDTAKTVPLAPIVVDGLRSMMAAVVNGGSGAPANVSGGAQVYGKTGTAEFGNATPPMTHAWFIGFRGDVAFAIIIEGGGVGGRVAGPIAAKFLKWL